MKSLLSQYRSVIDEYHPELSRALRPGLARESVVEKMSSLPFEISSDAVELYCWADGINQTKGKPHLIPISYFVPLESAIRNFESLLEFREMYGDFGQQYSESFPFLSDGSDGGYGFGSTDAPCSGRIIEYVIHDEWQIGFHSLTDLVETGQWGG